MSARPRFSSTHHASTCDMVALWRRPRNLVKPLAAPFPSPARPTHCQFRTEAIFNKFWIIVKCLILMFTILWYTDKCVVIADHYNFTSRCTVHCNQRWPPMFYLHRDLLTRCTARYCFNWTECVISRMKCDLFMMVGLIAVQCGAVRCDAARRYHNESRLLPKNCCAEHW